MRTTKLFFGVLATLATMSSTAAAQTSTGFAINRFDPSERGSDWFSTESLDLRGSNRFAIGVVGDWAHKPLVEYRANGTEKGPLIANQFYLHVGGTYILWDRLRLALNLPVLVANSGTSEPIHGVTLKEGAGIGDVRVGVDVRLLGTYGSVFTLAAGAQVHIPTGNRDAFSSDGKVRIVPRVMAAGKASWFVYSGRIGPNIRLLSEKFMDKPIGTELVFAAAAGASLAGDRLVIGPEIYGSTVVVDGGAFKRETTPFELIGGAHFKITDSFRLAAGVGPGLSRGFGAPKSRLLGAIEWVDTVRTASHQPADRDGDGIDDAEDACPDEAGVKSQDPKKHGCPLPSDRDGDGIPDEQDACPDEVGVASDDPSKNGCPAPSDRDGDGILDHEDACPEEAGPANTDPKKHGCPPPSDRDGDGITDDVDACPDQAGPANPDPKKHGCPKVVAAAGEIKINERVEFDTGKATIRPESNDILTGVLNFLRENPHIKKVSVEGHTDNRGVSYANQKLSRDRAASVVRWLTSRGIAASRLTSQGHGDTKPIDTNDTESGRQNNRRVEFRIVEQETQVK